MLAGVAVHLADLQGSDGKLQGLDHSHVINQAEGLQGCTQVLRHLVDRFLLQSTLRSMLLDFESMSAAQVLNGAQGSVHIVCKLGTCQKVQEASGLHALAQVCSGPGLCRGFRSLAACLVA